MEMYSIVILCDKRCLSGTVATLCIAFEGYGVVQDVRIVDSFVAFSGYY